MPAILFKISSNLRYNVHDIELDSQKKKRNVNIAYNFQISFNNATNITHEYIKSLSSKEPNNL